jgi:hypothetical protein
MSFVSMPFRLAALCLLSCLTFGARAELWEGTLGKSAIVAELDPAGDHARGRYFYRRHHRVIELSAADAVDGRASGKAPQAVTLEESSMDAQDTAYWRLEPAIGDARAGEWVGGGKRLPIRLRRIDPAALPATDDPWLVEVRKTDPFLFLQLQGLPLEAGKRETVAGYRLQWWREPNSDVALFRVIDGYPAAQLPAINRALAREQWRNVVAYFECTTSSNGEYDFSATLDYIGRDALSVALDAGYYCGGAHPDFDEVGLNLDPRTGRELVLEDVLWLGDGPPPAIGEDAGDEARAQYRNDVLAPWLSARFAALYPDQMREGGDEDGEGCDYTDPGLWTFGNWHITRDGLRFGAYFTRAVRVCDNPDWSVLPWQDVRAHPGRLRIEP